MSSFKIHDLKQNKVSLMTTAEQVEEAYQAYLRFQNHADQDDEKYLAEHRPTLKPAEPVQPGHQTVAKVSNRVRQTFVAQDDNE